MTDFPLYMNAVTEGDIREKALSFGGSNKDVLYETSNGGWLSKLCQRQLASFFSDF